MKFILALALLVTSAVQAQELCVDFYALASPKLDCDKVLATFEDVPRPCVAFLMQTFGADYTCLYRFAALPGVKTVKVIASNQSCCRLNRCEAFDRACGVQQVKDRIVDAAALCSMLSSVGINCMISPGLEHAWGAKTQKQIFRFARSIYPGPIVNNPVGNNAKIAITRFSDFVELHAIDSEFKGRACLFSNDGIDVNLSKQRRFRSSISIPRLLSAFERYKKNCHYLEIWWNNQGARDRFVRPSRRAFKIYLSDVFRVNSILRNYYK